MAFAVTRTVENNAKQFRFLEMGGKGKNPLPFLGCCRRGIGVDVTLNEIDLLSEGPARGPYLPGKEAIKVRQRAETDCQICLPSSHLRGLTISQILLEGYRGLHTLCGEKPSSSKTLVWNQAPTFEFPNR